MTQFQANYVKHERIFLKNDPILNEKWLQARIAEDPSILGLGDIILLDTERPQERAGRLDLLFADIDENRRYEVELMLGATDESHIIRTIEYWDIERRRYPAYEHCAVLVAEDITSRFLNVLALLAGTVPLVGIQLNALRVGESIVLDFVRVLDQRLLRRDDVTEAHYQAADRAYWIQKSNESILELADSVLQMINATSETPLQLKYNKYYIGLNDGIRARNFIYLKPRRKFLRVIIPYGWTDERGASLEKAGIDAEDHADGMVFNVYPADMDRCRDVIEQTIGEVVAEQD